MTKQVLIVDDDEGIREIIQFSLERATNWHIWTAASGKEGVAIARSRPLDLILLDVVMPKEDGIVIYKKLQANESTRTIPVILLTAKARLSGQEEFLSLGISGIITKPFKSKTLAQTISQIIGW